MKTGMSCTPHWKQEDEVDTYAYMFSVQRFDSSLEQKLLRDRDSDTFYLQDLNG
jgi:hypothetical protein